MIKEITAKVLNLVANTTSSTACAIFRFEEKIPKALEKY